MRFRFLAALLALWHVAGAAQTTVRDDSGSYTVRVPWLKTDNQTINNAYRIAMGDLLGNISLFRDGLLEKPVPVLLAGQGYPTPWTRDASINAWNGASILVPAVAKNTLLAVIRAYEEGPRVIGEDQYWDAIVWVTGAWHHYLYTGDREFLWLAFQVARNSIRYYEETEYDDSDGLFRGPGWSDGVAGYPMEYADSGGNSAISLWPKFNPTKISRPGYGIPMKALSTNCLHYNAYLLLSEMARELTLPVDPSWARKADRLKEAINNHLWSEDRGHYRFLAGPLGISEHEEAVGHAYALLFGIADDARAQLVLEHQHVAPAGVPCLWPNLERYQSPDGMSFGRHAGTIWPQIQGMWAHAAARYRKDGIFGHELFQLAKHAVRDNQFTEIYHPASGAIYGGLQERPGKGIVLWTSKPRQTWAASAYLRMILFGLVGMQVSRDGIRFEPCVPAELSQVEVVDLHVRNSRMDIAIKGKGVRLRTLTVSGTQLPTESVIPWDSWGQRKLTVVMEMQ
jgi:glycogen debranching enzyme